MHRQHGLQQSQLQDSSQPHSPPVLHGSTGREDEVDDAIIAEDGRDNDVDDDDEAEGIVGRLDVLSVVPPRAAIVKTTGVDRGVAVGTNVPCAEEVGSNRNSVCMEGDDAENFASSPPPPPPELPPKRRHSSSEGQRNRQLQQQQQLANGARNIDNNNDDKLEGDNADARQSHPQPVPPSRRDRRKSERSGGGGAAGSSHPKRSSPSPKGKL